MEIKSGDSHCFPSPDSHSVSNVPIPYMGETVVILLRVITLTGVRTVVVLDH